MKSSTKPQKSALNGSSLSKAAKERQLNSANSDIGRVSSTREAVNQTQHKFKARKKRRQEELEDVLSNLVSSSESPDSDAQVPETSPGTDDKGDEPLISMVPEIKRSISRLKRKNHNADPTERRKKSKMVVEDNTTPLRRVPRKRRMGSPTNEEVVEEMSPKKAPVKQNSPTKTRPKCKSQTSTYRGNFKPLVQLFEKMETKNLLTNEVGNLMDTTPFGQIYRILKQGVFENHNVRKPNNSVFQILSCYDKEKKAFRFGGKKVKLKVDDVSLIFGIPKRGKEVTLYTGVKKENPRSSFCQRHFSGGVKKLWATNVDIENAIFKITKVDSSAKVEDICRLIIIFMFATAFYPGSSSYVRFTAFPLLEDLHSMKSISWAKLIHTMLVAELDKWRKEKPFTISTCSILLVYFCLEHVAICNPIPSYSDTMPRLAKWDLHRLTFPTDLKTTKNVKVTTKLVPVNKREEELIDSTTRDGMKEVLHCGDKDNTEAEPPQNQEEVFHHEGQETSEEQPQNKEEMRNSAAGSPKIQNNEELQNLRVMIEDLQQRYHTIEQKNIALELDHATLEDKHNKLQENFLQMRAELDFLKRKDKEDDSNDVFDDAAPPSPEADTDKQNVAEKYPESNEVEDSTSVENLQEAATNVTQSHPTTTNLKEQSSDEAETHKGARNETTSHDRKATTVNESTAPTDTLKDTSIHDQNVAGKYTESNDVEDSTPEILKMSRSESETIESDSQTQKPKQRSLVKRVIERNDEKKVGNKDLKVFQRKKRKTACHETIDLETIITPPCLKRTLQPLCKSPNYTYIVDPRVKKTLSTFFEKAFDNSLAYYNKEKNIEVLGMDLENLLMDKFVNSRIIEWFAEWCQNLPRKTIKAQIFDPYGWAYILDKNEPAVCKHLYDPIQVMNLKMYNMLFFPMNSRNGGGSSSYKGYHWTLLVLDVCKNFKWTHYDSLTSRSENNPHFEDAKQYRNTLAWYIERHHKLTKIEKSCLTVDDVTSGECPQQGITPDCAMFVCKYMLDLLLDREVQYLEDIQHEISKFKTYLAYKVLSNEEYSWKDDDSKMK